MWFAISGGHRTFDVPNFPFRFLKFQGNSSKVANEPRTFCAIRLRSGSSMRDVEFISSLSLSTRTTVGPQARKALRGKTTNQDDPVLSTAPMVAR